MTKIDSPTLALLDEQFSAWQHGLPEDVQGLAVCIRDACENIILQKAYGLHNKKPDRPQPLNADALLPVASHSKTFTATAIHQLIQDGKIHPASGRPLSLDDKIITLLPELNVNWMQGITLCDALAHNTRMGFDHAEREMSPQAFREKNFATWSRIP
jgi:CubicO group peptidase (beta-lactamase class C family)